MRALVVAGVLAAFFVGSTAQAQSSNPDWLKMPDSDELLAVWPAKALNRQIEGKATLACEVNTFGGLENCVVDSETPEGEGFGAAALLLAPGFQMKPKILRGKPVRGGVRIPIAFKWPDGSRSSTGGRAPLAQGEAGVSFMMVTTPVWRTAPSFADVLAVWPKRAKDITSAKITMRCRVEAGGGIAGCGDFNAEPTHKGFEAAARKLAPLFTLAVDPTVGQKKSVFVNVAVTFADPAVTPAARSVTRPLWIRGLDPTKAAEVFPPAAAEKGLTSGTGVADCAVAKDGSLTDCTVAREDPVGLGFGPAAVAIARVMQMSPWTADGRPVDGARIKLPIRLEKGPDEAAPDPAPAVR